MYGVLGCGNGYALRDKDWQAKRAHDREKTASTVSQR
jgi:hypothetical protein